MNLWYFELTKDHRIGFMTSTSIQPSAFETPAQACDCHVHVFLPEQFPYDDRRAYTPPAAGLDSLGTLRAALGVERSVLVQPSCYGNDNGALCWALTQLGPAAARGVAVVDPARVSDEELQHLHDAGVRGLRLNLHVSGQDTDDVLRLCAMASERVQHLGWHLQLYAGPQQAAAIKKVLRIIKVPIVLDHFGGGAAVADLLCGLLAHENLWVKLSAPYRASALPDHADLQPVVQRYLRIAPDRLVWGSDWPHTGGDGKRSANPTAIEPFRREDARVALARLADWVGDRTLMASILVHNPARLYGFDPD